MCWRSKRSATTRPTSADRPIGLFKGKQQVRPHIVASNVEHPAVIVCLEALENQGKITVTFVPVQPDGCVKASDVIAALTENTILVTLMLANNESGALQPVKDCAQECRKRGILFHTDAAQAVGKVSYRLDDLGEPDMVRYGVSLAHIHSQAVSQSGRHSHLALSLAY